MKGMIRKGIAILFLMGLWISVSAQETIKIYSEAFGNKTDPAILLNAGAGNQSITWATAFCQQLAKRGYYVIRYDYRDSGLSTAVDYTKAPYTVMDLMQDALNVLNQHNIKKAHFVGFSMGGQLAQFAGAYSPDRTLSLVLIATSPDFKPGFGAFGMTKSTSDLSHPTMEYIKWVSRPVDITQQTLNEKVNDYVISWKLLDGSPTNFDEAFYREQGKEHYTRTTLHQPFRNHAQAMCASFDLHAKAIPLIHCPTLIIHGEKDPVFPPDHAKKLAQAVPHSTFVLWEDFGHALSPRNFDRLIDNIDNFVKSKV
jgi:pimeloyl-ACP methyl ester carboxylesterase